ncbi:hypothetical protein [Dyella sp. 2HG41-7]|uniref:hypothetical protein n=1 Tax=Dyella sp. 2HG41-7 TaxID=2883239 RepID=UPI001F22F1E6|nr:hypothetical protein [Dyella sp. 2HG41-7]
MGKITNRIQRLEERLTEAAIDEVGEDHARLQGWPKIVLQRYCEGRLDELAATYAPVRKLLCYLAEHGYAVQCSDIWHPLYALEDEKLNQAVVDRLNAQHVEAQV